MQDFDNKLVDIDLFTMEPITTNDSIKQSIRHLIFLNVGFEYKSAHESAHVWTMVYFSGLWWT